MANDVEGGLDLQVANPKVLGFGVFAILAWMYAMVWAGWFPTDVFASATALDVAILATYALLVAALASFLRGESWHAVFFMFWAAYAWALQVQAGEAEVDAYGAWLFVTVAVFHGLLCWGAFRKGELGTDRALVTLGTALAFVGFALAQWGVGVFGVVGGYLGLATALVAFWAAATEIGDAAVVA